MLSLPQLGARKGTKLGTEHRWVFPDWEGKLCSNSDMRLPGA